jgi:hypothetical protein
VIGIPYSALEDPIVKIKKAILDNRMSSGIGH